MTSAEPNSLQTSIPWLQDSPSEQVHFSASTRRQLMKRAARRVRAGNVRLLVTTAIGALFSGLVFGAGPDAAVDISGAGVGDAAEPSSSGLSLHAQATLVSQRHGTFTSPYSGQNSLRSHEGPATTFDATAFIGARLWKGGEAYINPEIDQGFGLSDTVGVAGFPSGEAYKVGHSSPYGRLQRAFLRQTVALGGDPVQVESAANQLPGVVSANRIVLTAGKLSVVDIFDTNAFAHDPRSDFLNWGVIDTAAFDYAADAWGYTLGASAEWITGNWTTRLGNFATSTSPNAETLDTSFAQHQWVLELERRYAFGGHPGAVRALAFTTQARAAAYADATSAVANGSTPPDLASLRLPRRKHGFAINAQQEFPGSVGAFARLGINDGRSETLDFTDVNRSLALGLSLGGGSWGRAADNLGIAVATNALSQQARQYFAAGGMGIVVGDGRLPHYKPESTVEVFYKLTVREGLEISADFQHVTHPGYNADRGPVGVAGLRLHAEI